MRKSSDTVTIPHITTATTHDIAAGDACISDEPFKQESENIAKEEADENENVDVENEFDTDTKFDAKPNELEMSQIETEFIDKLSSDMTSPLKPDFIDKLPSDMTSPLKVAEKLENGTAVNKQLI